MHGYCVTGDAILSVTLRLRVPLVGSFFICGLLCIASVSFSSVAVARHETEKDTSLIVVLCHRGQARAFSEAWAWHT